MKAANYPPFLFEVKAGLLIFKTYYAYVLQILPGVQKLVQIASKMSIFCAKAQLLSLLPNSITSPSCSLALANYLLMFIWL